MVEARELFRVAVRLIQGVGGRMSSDISSPMLVKPEVGGGGGWPVLHHSALGDLESGSGRGSFHVLRRVSLLLFHSRVSESRELECLSIENLSLNHLEDVH